MSDLKGSPSPAKTIRLDKYVADSLVLTRKQAKERIKGRRVAVGGVLECSPDRKIVLGADLVEMDGALLAYSEYCYLMLNKPAGLVCASEDQRDGTVFSLLPDQYRNKNLFSAGRLDKDTVGLLLLTNDGPLAHQLLSPSHHVHKTYFVLADRPFAAKDGEIFEKGIVLDGKLTRPAKLDIVGDDPKKAYLTLTEGKYHEVKRLCAAVGKTVLQLERVSFGPLSLDRTLRRGEWRPLTEREVQLLRDASDGPAHRMH